MTAQNTQSKNTEQQEEQLPFLDRVLDRSQLSDTNDAQVATKIVFRIMRDMMPTSEIDRVESELQADAPKADMKIADLWNDLNVFVAFFSRVSPMRQLSIGYDTFMLRLKQEGQLPESVEPENVTHAVFSATKEELSNERASEIENFLPEKLKLMWQQA